jgi:hypothetical protein
MLCLDVTSVMHVLPCSPKVLFGAIPFSMPYCLAAISLGESISALMVARLRKKRNKMGFIE